MPLEDLGDDRARGYRLTKVFFCDSGSIAVEVAMQMALQYWRAVAPNNAWTAFLALTHGYAMSLSEANGVHAAFACARALS